MQIRSIASFDAEKKKLTIHYNKDAAVTHDPVVTRSRMHIFNHNVHEKAIRRAFQFVIENKRFSKMTHIEDDKGYMHYLWPDKSTQKIYHFCAGDDSVKRLTRLRESIKASYQARYKKGERLNQYTQKELRNNRVYAKSMLAQAKEFERTNQALAIAMQRGKVLSSELVSAIISPVRALATGTSNVEGVVLASKLQELLDMNEAYTAPEHTIEADGKEIQRLRLMQKRLEKQIFQLTKAGPIEDIEAFDKIVAKYESVLADIEIEEVRIGIAKDIPLENSGYGQEVDSSDFGGDNNNNNNELQIKKKL